MDPHVTVRMQITIPPSQVFETVWNFPMDHFLFSEKDPRYLSRIPCTIVITILLPTDTYPSGLVGWAVVFK